MSHPTPWKLQYSNRAKGPYFQAVHGRGKDRLALTLGYLSEEDAALAASRISSLPEPSRLFQVRFDGETGGLVNSSKAAKTATVRQLLLGCDLEEAVEAIAHASAARLEAAGDYGEMRLRDFVHRLWMPVRAAERVAGTVDRERRTWDKKILPVLGDVKLKSLDAIKWQRFLAAQDTWGGRSKALAQNAYRCCMSYAVEVGAIPEVHAFRPIPNASKVQNPKVPLLADEVAALLDAAGSSTHRALYAVAIGQGLRPGEVVRLRWEDLDLGERTIRIRGIKTQLSDATVPLTPLSRIELTSYWLELGKPSEGVMFTWEGKPILEFKGSIRRAAKRAGITSKVTPYVCRHTFACLAAEAGIPRAMTRKMMRHSHSSTILERAYSNVRQEQVRGAFADFGVGAAAAK